MRTTLNLDDELIATAVSFTGVTERAELIRQALRALIEREAAHRMVRLGGSQPELRDIPRRRSVA